MTVGQLRKALEPVPDYPWVCVPGGMISAVEIELGAAEPFMLLRSTAVETREQRTRQPLADPKLTIEVALREADRCRQYPDPVLNEQVIVVLADEVLKLRPEETTAQPPDWYCPNCDCDLCGAIQGRLERSAVKATDGQP